MMYTFEAWKQGLTDLAVQHVCKMVVYNKVGGGKEKERGRGREGEGDGGGGEKEREMRKTERGEGGERSQKQRTFPPQNNKYFPCPKDFSRTGKRLHELQLLLEQRLLMPSLEHWRVTLIPQGCEKLS